MRSGAPGAVVHGGETLRQVWRCDYACKMANPTRIVCEIVCMDENPMMMALPNEQSCPFFGTDEARFKVVEGPKTLPDGWSA